MSSMKVLLTGATGLLGHNVLRRLMDEGHQVVALVRRADGICLPQEGFQTVVGSLLDYGTLCKAAEGCEAIVNCAGVTDMSLLRYEDYLSVNRDLPKMLVRLMKEHGINTLVHTSTVNTIGYGTAEKPADESVPMCAPFKGSYYAESKREGELAVLAAATEGRHVIVINPGFMLGPYDVKPSSGRLLLAADKKLLMLAPRGGKAFVDVRDVANAVVSALTRGKNGSRYIVAGDTMSFADLYRCQARICGYPLHVFTVPNWLLLSAGRVGDMLRWMGVKTQVSTRNIRQLLVCEHYDNSHAISDLGVSFSSIEDAISNFFTWKRKQKKI